MHKFSTASPKSLVLTALRSVGPYSTLAGALVARLVRPALSALRDENLCKIRATVVLVWMMTTALAIAETPQQLIGKLQQRYEQIQSFSADFEQIFQGRGVLLRESGIVNMKKPGKMYWEYRKPNRKLFVADGKKSYFYVPSNNQVIVADLDLSQAQVPLLFLMGKGDLQEDFHIDLEEKEKILGTDNALLSLTPKELQAGFSRVILEVNRSTYLIHRLIVIEPVGNRNEYILTNMRQDVSVPDRLFVFKVPDGTEVLSQ